MPEDILTPITRVLLKENDNLALILPRDIGKKPTFELYFFRVARRYVLHRTYDSELPTISAGGTVEFKKLGETGLGAGDDILTIWEERPFRILHFGFGIRPSEIWLYKSQPSGFPQTGWGYMEPPDVGDKRDYVPGYLSPYDSPTTATESVLYHKLSLTIGLKNDSSRDIRPSLRILGAGYDVIPITDKTFIDKMIAGVKPVRYVTVGGLSMFTYVVPDEWKGNGVVVDKETIEKVMRGA